MLGALNLEQESTGFIYPVNFRNLCRWRYVLAFAAILELFSAPVRAQKLTIKIPPTKIPLQVKDQPIAITAYGVVSMVTQNRDLYVFTLELDADLSDLQQNMTPLLSAELDRDEPCGDRIMVQHATLLPVPPASVTTVEFHYERWACVKLFGKTQTKRLIGGNATVQLKLTPAIDKDNAELRLEPEITDIEADGSLGELLRSGSLGEMLKEKIRSAILAAMRKGTDLRATLPPAIQGYATIQTAEFRDEGSQRLLVVLGGEARITKEQVQALSEQVKERVATVH
jgi:hypothetical protein